jgi:hypothetical protein
LARRPLKNRPVRPGAAQTEPGAAWIRREYRGIS